MANFEIIEYSFTFWTGSAALEIYMSNLEELTLLYFLFNKIFEKVVLEFSILLLNNIFIFFLFLYIVYTKKISDTSTVYIRSWLIISIWTHVLYFVGVCIFQLFFSVLLAFFLFQGDEFYIVPSNHVFLFLLTLFVFGDHCYFIYLVFLISLMLFVLQDYKVLYCSLQLTNYILK